MRHRSHWEVGRGKGDRSCLSRSRRIGQMTVHSLEQPFPTWHPSKGQKFPVCLAKRYWLGMVGAAVPIQLKCCGLEKTANSFACPPYFYYLIDLTAKTKTLQGISFKKKNQYVFFKERDCVSPWLIRQETSLELNSCSYPRI